MVSKLLIIQYNTYEGPIVHVEPREAIAYLEA